MLISVPESRGQEMALREDIRQQSCFSMDMRDIPSKGFGPIQLPQRGAESIS